MPKEEKPLRLRVGVLTSVDVRHRFVVNRLCSEFQVVAVGYEKTGYSPAAVPRTDLDAKERSIVAHHFEERSLQETQFFGHDAEFLDGQPDRTVVHIEPGHLNTPETLLCLTSAKADVVVVYGTNLIKSPLLDHWAGRLVNLHLGLSPYYRGTATNFYPLLNEEPQYVGATIHLLDAGIDSGPLLRHARPDIVAKDMPHTIGCKAILAGVDALIASLKDLERGQLKPVPQWTVDHPRLYLRKDYHPRQVVELYQKIENGLIPRYVERAAEPASQVRLLD